MPTGHPPDTGAPAPQATSPAAPASPPGEPAVGAFDAFISYSRQDGAFAERLHQALARYAPPKGVGVRSGRLRVFRDTSDFTGSDYYRAIEAHLAASRKLIVVCSPAAAASQYVDDEIARFVRLHGAGHVVPVLWQGLPNNEATGDRTAQRAFPPALTGSLTMPLAADFRGFDPASQRLDDEATHSAWTMLLATLLGVSRAELEQRELKRRRATRRAWTLGLSAVFTALLGLTLWALFEGERALARQLAAQASLRGGLEPADVERRVLLAREAVLRMDRLGEPTTGAEAALRDALASFPRRRFALPAPPARSGERVVAFSGDGQFLLAAHGTTLTVHSLVNGTPQRTVRLPRALRHLAASADLRHVAAVDVGGRLQTWRWPELAPVGPLPPEVGAAPVDCVTFSERGVTLVALRVQAAGRARVELLRWRPGERRLVDSAAAVLPRAAAGSSGGGCLTARDPAGASDPAVGALLPLAPAADGEGDGAALWWPVRSAEATAFAFAPLPATAARVTPGVVALALAEDGAPVTVDREGRVARVESAGLGAVAHGAVLNLATFAGLSPRGSWAVAVEGLHDPIVPLLKPTRFDVVHPESGVVLRSVADHAGYAAFTPDEETLVTASGRRIRLWDRRDGRERLRLYTARPVDRLLFDGSSRQLAAIAEDGSLEVFELGEPDERLRLGHRTDAVLLGPGAGAVLVAGSRLLWPGRTGGALPAPQELGGHVHSVEASADGRFVMVRWAATPFFLGEPPGQLVLIERRAQGPVVRYRGPWGERRFDREGRRLLVAGSDGVVRMIDPATGRVRWRRRVGAMTPPPAAALTGWRPPLALAADGSVAAVPRGDGAVVLLAGDDGRVLREEQVRPIALALSADGRLLARNGAKDSIDVVRVADGATVRRFEGRELGSRALAFSPRGRLLLMVGGRSFSTFMSGGHFVEEHAVVWDVETGARVARVPSSGRVLADYQELVGSAGDEPQQLTGLVWSPSGTELAGTLFPSMLAYWTVPSSMVRGTLVAWRLTDDGLVETYRTALAASLSAAAMSAAGTAVLAVAEDGYRRVVALTGMPLVEASCAALPRAPTPEDRRAVLGSGWRRLTRCPGRGAARR